MNREFQIIIAYQLQHSATWVKLGGPIDETLDEPKSELSRITLSEWDGPGFVRAKRTGIRTVLIP